MRHEGSVFVNIQTNSEKKINASLTVMPIEKIKKNICLKQYIIPS